MIEARVWQRRHRPPVGHIAQQWGMLSAHQVAQLLTTQGTQHRFCDLAVQKGLLSSFQRLAVLGRQRMVAPKLDEFWLAKGWLGASELEELKRLATHQRISVDYA